MIQYLYSIYEDFGDEGNEYDFASDKKLTVGEWCRIVQKAVKSCQKKENFTTHSLIKKIKKKGFKEIFRVDQLFVNPPDTVEYVSRVSYFVEDGDVQE
jgi:hypothetical protein